ncbi:ATP-binding cassette domain-containing protein [Lysinibacter cavernae]|uniref:Macrolide transport system ATP-binding/permease protein n=1 Tax=Lysinibacter cavernae TaxID=1640652 RepID=A0A7X5R2C2_9MICO|nr:ATP-binding cassette domain-containing protein [Lysinibacter cavernae]NIH54304.1 macrolide transport system ATP-binding/permease protein [Lysinibacter cavernae]
MLQLSLLARDVRKHFSDRRVLDGIDLTVAPGSRVGLVGENGSGKSTLLRLLAGLDTPDSGVVDRPAATVYVDQDPVFADGVTVGGVFAKAVASAHDTVALLERLGEQLAVAGASEYEALAAEYSEVMEWAVDHDVWDADRRATLTADRMGIGGLDRSATVETLSGGQRARLALAAALIALPDALLLDEPTNHLDDAACQTLASFLRDFRGAVVLASHDRVFLDEICTDIVDLDAGFLGVDGNGGRRFGGNFSEYLAAKAAARARWERRYAEQQAEIMLLTERTAQGMESVAHGRGPRDNDKFIHAFKGQNVERTVARRVHAAEHQLELIERELVPKPPIPLSFDGSALKGGAADGLAIEASNLHVAGRLQLESMAVEAGSKVLVTGPNGAGKSTLLETIAGGIRPSSGSLKVRGRVGLLGQDARFAEPRRSVADSFTLATRRDVDVLRRLGLVQQRDLSRPIGALSLGQQKRVMLAIVVARQPSVVLLDEPTNHLSLVLVDELEEALRQTSATVLVASHDRWLRSRWVGERLELSA